MVEELKKSKHHVYKIVANGCNQCYIGSTSQLEKRMSNHTALLSMMNEYSNVSIIILETIDNCTRKEATIREQFYLDQHDNTMNKIKAYRSVNDYKEYMRNYMKQHYTKGSMKHIHNAHRLKRCNDYLHHGIGCLPSKNIMNKHKIILDEEKNEYVYGES